MIRRGFTMIEVLIALGLLAALGGAVFAFMGDLWRGRDAWRASAEDERGVSMLMDRLEEDLASCVAGGGGLGAGIRGEAGRLLVISRGVGVPVGVSDASSAKRELSDLRVCEYRFDSGRRSLMGRRTPGTRASGEWFEVLPGVERFTMRYFDGRAWAETFDSEKTGVLPVAVEVLVWLSSGGPAVDENAIEGESSPTEPEVESDPLPPEPEREGEFADDASPAAPAVLRGVRAADRRRLIVIPDGPLVGWKEGS
ncbi:MAG: prepilin-type N-terminal cleavage/methylation domain-containing protein [Phycisphaeraceae bacterium]|nr:MAG: prepilin-type N-terminal cleavage/methylation domain-containing protein [Phycisphaeraceae bacterium]